MSENTACRIKNNSFFCLSVKLAILSLLFISCATVKPHEEQYGPLPEAQIINENPYQFPVKKGRTDLEIIVLGDLHGYDTDSLVDDYMAWSGYLKVTKKVFDGRFENTKTALDKAAFSDADFIIIPGDLTVNGDKVSHRLLAGILRDFEKSGKKVYVVPGNHDVKNSKGLQFLENRRRHAENISPKEFAANYSRFGYKEAFSRDKTSLSYAAIPMPGIVLLCLDTAQWRKNRGFPFRYTPPDGSITDSTFKWAEKILDNAGRKGETVIAVHHHPLDGEFRDSEKIIELYEKYRVQLVVTGHRHKYMISYADDLPMLIAPNLSSGPDNTLYIKISGKEATALLNPYNFPE